MWKVLLLFAFAAGVILVAADDTLDESATVVVEAGTGGDTASTQDTTYTAGTISTSESVDNQATKETSESVDNQATKETDATGCTPRCKEDEVYEDFKDHVCMPLTCSELGFPLKCDQRTPGCICKDNKVRAEDGCCVTIEECPSCGGDPNAKKGCGSNCGKTCATYKIKPVKCPIGCLFNGCDCKDGFVYDPNIKKCVLPSECTPTCGANEVFSTCSNGGCGARNCSQVGKSGPCVDPKVCVKGCVCDTGYLRASNGTCVPKDQCGGEGGCGGDPNAEPGCGTNCGKTCTSYKSKPVACSDVCVVGGCDCKKGFVFDSVVKKCVLPADCSPRCKEDEVYEDFKDHVCMPLTCSELGFPLKCDQRTPGCICKDNKVRAEDGCCVTIEECPSCGGDPNAKKGCGSNCGKTCATYKIKPVKCPIGCLFNGCDCKDGFVYDPNIKKCVLPSECTPTCGANEVFSTCSNGGCGARNCSQVGKSGPCVDPKVCVKGCVCDTGYLRASNGTCVPKDQCGGEGGCGGDPNAEPGCGTNCGKTCTSYKSKPVACSDVCVVGGCDCKKGFVFDSVVKKCVLPADCSPPPCPEGEIYNKCPNVKCDGDYCPLTRDSPLTCPVGIVCDPPRCVCGFNSHRDRKTGKCIATADCPPFACNGPNEEYQPCPPVCPGENCSVYINNATCPSPRIGIVVPCTPQCKCKKGYYRNADGVCIIGYKCKTGSCGGDPNAKPGCGVNCGKTCSTYKIKHPFCPTYCKPDGCDCKDGFVFDPNQQKCVKPEDCTPTCGANEVFSTCINGGCAARNCSQVGKSVPCAHPKYCVKGCVCDTGYLRASNGTCVPKDQCGGGGDGGCGGDPNAEPGCGTNCGKTCTSYNTAPDACPDVCVVGGCDCKKGFAFDSVVNKCVLLEDCSPRCGQNEIVSSCSNGGCGPFNCSDLGKPILCRDPIKCRKGCVCKNTYLRAKNGTCVPKEQCPGPCGGDPNAKPGCGVNCGKTCSTYKVEHPICPRFCKPNGCDCIDGFVFDPNQQKCVLPEDCTPTCGLNEVYSPCINGGCDTRNCSQVGKPVPCARNVRIDPKYCIKGCVCNTGYLRASNGTCVPKDQCSSEGGCGGDPNAEPGCGINCGRTCTTYNTKSVNCPAICYVGGCDCKPGFVFDGVTKRCVLPEDCSKCSGQNEYFDTCIKGCASQNCSDIGRIFFCPREPAICRTGCRCKPGFYRNTDNVCIPESECPPRCGPHEIVSNCSNGGCGPFNCSDLGKPILCRDPIKCTKGCVCENTYLRAENGTCVPKDQCPGPCGGDPNAKPGCGVNCGKTCSTYKAKNPICPRICKPNGCDCKDGFVFDPNQEKCVPPEDCTPTCGLNEVYSACINGGCDARNCSQYGKPVPCVKINPKYCIKGCVCDKDYLRASNGTCVPKDQCPLTCSGQNEFFDTCISGCGSQNCSDIGKIFHCPRLPPYCRTGCRCKPGFYRNTYNVCIPESECPKCPNPNEVFDVCPAPCPPRRCDVDDRLIRCVAPPKPGDPACKPDCRCADGYARNAKGICVPRSQCDKPENKCRENEVFNPCIRTCPPQRCGIDPALVLCANPGPDVSCQPGCDCIDGYVRNDIDVCIPKDQCPKCTGPNEYFDTCISGCGSQNCSDIGKIFNCPLQPAVCKTGCRCNPGFYRNTDNVCVPESECPKCTGPNEYLDPCKSTCTNQSCNDIGTVRSCPAQRTEDCKPGCSCKKGFARNENNVCIAESECQCTRPNEYLEPCAPFLCSNQTCDNIAKPYNCPRIGDCRPACLCKKGFWRNSANVCVPANECPAKCTGQNEYFDKCISDCSNQTCAAIGQSYSCPAQVVCKTGCRQAAKCTGQNEYFDKCISDCSNQTCAAIGQSYSCPAHVVCKTGCRCNPGFWRNDDNVCIPENQCPTPPCPEGETYNRCPTVKCEGDYCPKTRDSPLTCPVGVVCDPPRCVCRFNSHRDRNTGKCIATANCPPFACNGPNEEYQPCPPTCPGEKCSDYINNSKCPPFRIGIVVPCKPQCKCKKGYYRNDDNICISSCKCGPKNTDVTTPPPTTKPIDCGNGNGSVDITSLQAGIADFTGKFLYDRIQASPGENIIISPYSVFNPLAQLALRAIGEALKQLLAVLHLNSKEEIRSKFPYLVASYDGQTSVNFSQADLVCLNEATPPSDSFIKDSVIFHADIKNLNFSNPILAAADINSWVANKTNNYITDLVSPDMFSPATRVVLVNAIALKGAWLHQFNEKNTQDQPFYLGDGTNKTVKLMYQEAQFNYGEFPEYGCKMLQMWYVGQNFSMVTILPDEVDGVTNLAETLQNFTIFNQMYSSLTSQKVKVWYPKFEIRTTTDLVPILKQQNVQQIFNKTDSELRDIVVNQKDNFYVSSAVEKAVLKVDENGSEAYAANAFVISARTAAVGPRENPLEFKANHGFIFVIFVKGNSGTTDPIPVFTGTFQKP